MPHRQLWGTALMLGILTGNASAAIQNYTDEAAWLNALPATPEVLTFTGNTSHAPLQFAVPPHLTITQTGGVLVFDNQVIDTQQVGVDVQEPVFAIGFAVRELEDLALWAMFLEGSGEFVYTGFNPDFFYGFISDIPINTVTMVGDGDFHLDTFSYVPSTPVIPEPSVVVMLGVGVLWSVTKRHRRYA